VETRGQFASLFQSPLLKGLMMRAKKLGQPLYLVGGYLRNILAGRPTTEVDVVTTNAEGLACSYAAEAGVRPVRIDQKFGTIRLLAASAELHREVDKIDVSPLRGVSITEDLRQRDFTVNAVAIDLLICDGRGEVELIDPLGGVADIEARRLRLCSAESFAQDPLRILRGYRLMATQGFLFDPETHAAVLEQRQGLKRIAVERIRDELSLILSTDRTADIFQMLDADGVLPLILPECEPMRGLEQNDYHHLDVWQHSLAALKALETVLHDPTSILDRFATEAMEVIAEPISSDRRRLDLLKLATLIHDIGKPRCRSVDESNTVHFYSHDKAGIALARDLCLRLRFSKAETSFVSKLVGHHMWLIHLFRLGQPSNKALSRFFRLGPELFWPLLFLFLGDYLATLGPRSWRGDRTLLRQRLLDWLNYYESTLQPKEDAPPLVNGRDLIKHLGIEPGPAVGKLLEQLSDLQWRGEIKSRKEALQRAADLFAEMQESEHESS